MLISSEVKHNISGGKQRKQLTSNLRAREKKQKKSRNENRLELKLECLTPFTCKQSEIVDGLQRTSLRKQTSQIVD